MIQVVCSVFDRASRLYGRPVFVAAAGQAIRSFGDEVNRTGEGASEFSRHPEDFELFQLAVFDDEAGSFQDELRLLARGSDLKSSKE